MAAPTTSEMAHWNLRVECPHCGLIGRIPWDQELPRKRVRCHRCEQWFRIEPKGSATKTAAPDAAITVAVRAASSGWRQHLAPESGRLEQRRRWRALDGWRHESRRRAGFAAAAALCAVVAIGWQILGGPTAHERDGSAYQEPEAVADRAAAFSLAWACNDTPTMTRFTAPDQTKSFVSWLRRAQLAPVFDDAQPNEVETETISVTPQKERRCAIVTVRLALRAVQPPPKGAGGYTQRAVWTEVDGKWFFAPEETIKLSIPPPAVQWR